MANVDECDYYDYSYYDYDYGWLFVVSRVLCLALFFFKMSQAYSVDECITRSQITVWLN